MRKLLVIEIILLVLVLAAAAYFIWDISNVQPNVAPVAPVAAVVTEPTEVTEPETVPEQTEAPEATEPAPTEPEETLRTKDTWAKVLNDHELTAENYFIYDLSEDRFLLRSDSADTKIYPASVTKLFTAYVALKHAPKDEKITVGKEIEMIDVDSSVAKLKVGDVLTVEQLVGGMILPSGNDAAYAIAAGVGRYLAKDPDMSAKAAVARFVEQMNKDADELGMTGSHFVTPDGNHADAHYIGLEDLVIVGKLALENEVIADYAAQATETITTANSRSLEWKNTNSLIREASDYYCEQAIGLKTGYTTPAGYCLLSVVRIGERDLLIGVFGSEEKEVRFADTLYLLAQNFRLDIYEPVSNLPDASVANTAG